MSSSYLGYHFVTSVLLNIGQLKYPKNAQKRICKGDSSTGHAQFEFLRNKLRYTQIAMTLF